MEMSSTNAIKFGKQIFAGIAFKVKKFGWCKYEE